MTFGIKQFKNNKRRGYLEFSTGKRIALNDTELREFESKINYWQGNAKAMRADQTIAKARKLVDFIINNTCGCWYSDKKLSDKKFKNTYSAICNIIEN